MSLDISVNNPVTGESMELNWLRNPFGLCAWAEDTLLYETKTEAAPEGQSLYYAINHWNYDKSSGVDKPLFRQVVQRYGEVILNVEKGYFWFPLDRFPDNLSCHIAPGKNVNDLQSSLRDGNVVNGDFVRYQDKIGVPIEQCAKFISLGHADLEYYKGWYGELIHFAEILQAPDAVFYCSN
jgi:hypothetical protein